MSIAISFVHVQSSCSRSSLSPLRDGDVLVYTESLSSSEKIDGAQNVDVSLPLVCMDGLFSSLDQCMFTLTECFVYVYMLYVTIS